EHPRHVGLDRVRRDMEPRRDLLVGTAGRQLVQDLELAFAEAERGPGLRVAVEGCRRWRREGACADEHAERQEAGGDQEQVDVGRVQPRQAMEVEPLKGDGAEGKERSVAEHRLPGDRAHAAIRCSWYWRAKMAMSISAPKARMYLWWLVRILAE